MLRLQRTHDSLSNVGELLHLTAPIRPQEPPRECGKCARAVSELEGLEGERRRLAQQLEEVMAANEELKESHKRLEGQYDSLVEERRRKETFWRQRERELQEEV